MNTEPTYNVLTYKYNLERYAFSFYEAKEMSKIVERSIRTRLKLKHKALREGSFSNGYQKVTIFALPSTYQVTIPKNIRVTLTRRIRKYVTLEVQEMTHTDLNRHLDRYGAKKLPKPAYKKTPKITLEDVKASFRGLEDIQYRDEDGGYVYLDSSLITIILREVLRAAKDNHDDYDGFMGEMVEYIDLWFSTRRGPDLNAQEKFFDMCDDFASEFIKERSL
jgi:hypothetical protein